jgi:iron complex outermembrane recepter protein
VIGPRCALGSDRQRAARAALSTPLTLHLRLETRKKKAVIAVGYLLKALLILLRSGCVLALPVVAMAQPVSQLSGVISDTTGGALPGATVIVSGAALAAPRTVVTNDRGRYELDALPAGRYLVSASLNGFESVTAWVDVEAGPATLDLTLAVSSFSDRVTVTATKTGTSDVQSTPIAVTALPGRTLEQLGIQTVEGLAGFVPTLVVSQNTGAAQVTIRGIGTNSTVVGADPSSTVHVDGVYLGRPVMAFAELMNVERVEVLRGPQGTLYGRNSVGGTINVVTRQPTNMLEGSLRLTAGNYDKLRAEGAISGPLVKNKVMGNFAFLRSSREGFVKDLDHADHSLGGEDTWTGRGQLRLVFGKRNELLLSGDYGRFDGNPLTYAKPIASKRVPGLTFDSPVSLWEVRADQLASAKNTQQGASARLAFHLNPTTTLNSLTAYRKSNYRFFIDGDATELSLQTSDVPDLQRQFSQELTIVQRTPRLTWIGGVFFFEDDNEGQVEITVYPIATQIRPFARIGTHAAAVFGQATYTVSSRVSVTAGARYTGEQKDLDATGGEYRLGTAMLTSPDTFYDFAERATYDAWTPRISLQVQGSRAAFVYVSATRGFKSGGFNPAAREAGRGFSPEFAWSYEGGLKGTVAGGLVRANTAVFYSDYQDLQVQSFLRPGVPDISNAASATIRGIEFEMAGADWHGMQLSGTVSWLEALYDDYLALLPGGRPLDAAGNRLNNAPRWSGSGSAVYGFPIEGAGTAALRADVSWQSRVFFTPVNDIIETQRAYGLLHVRAGFEPRSRRWEVAVYVRNLGNQDYITGTANVPIPAISGRPGDPRQWGTQFTLRR